jgi:hypothetical protein
LKLPAGSIAIGGIILSSPSAAGSRKHQVDQNDGDILTNKDDGKVTFSCSCEEDGLPGGSSKNALRAFARQ